MLNRKPATGGLASEEGYVKTFKKISGRQVILLSWQQLTNFTKEYLINWAIGYQLIDDNIDPGNPG